MRKTFGFVSAWMTLCFAVTVSAALPPVEPSTLSGDITIAGAPIVFPIVSLGASAFNDEGFNGNITIDSISNSANGFDRFCNDQASDIVMASRRITQQEQAACRANNLYPIPFIVGTQALIIFANPTFATSLDSLSLEELELAFTTATNWNDVRPNLPQQPIIRFTTGQDNTTFDYFVEVVLAGNPTPLLQATNTQRSEDDTVLINGVAGNTFAVGFADHQLTAFASNIARIPVADVAPTVASVQDETYPLSQILYLYTDAGTLQRKPQVAGYLNYVLQNSAVYAQQSGFIAPFLAQSEVNEQRYRTAQTAVPGQADIDQNGIFTASDAIYIINRVGSQDMAADLNNDNIIDEVDVQLILDVIGEPVFGTQE